MKTRKREKNAKIMESETERSYKEQKHIAKKNEQRSTHKFALNQYYFKQRQKKIKIM